MSRKSVGQRRGFVCSRSVFDFEGLLTKEKKFEAEMAESGFWDNRNAALEVITGIKKVQNWTTPLKDLDSRVGDLSAALELLELEDDPGIRTDAEIRCSNVKRILDRLEFRQMLSGEHDGSDCILTVRSGAGGVDSHDWTEMLMKMYIFWGEKQNYEISVLDTSPGDGVGMREAVLAIRGPYAYGYLSAEKGIHRLVRKSPFDQNHRRHTSFASVFPLPELDDSIEVEINPEDVRTDVFRSSGAGGQHINKTSSAVRLTHMPSGIVVTCQNERSQHRNRDLAWKVLRARLYELEEEKRRKEREKLEGTKSDVSWGHQIRSYVLQPYQMVKDHRTDMETSDVDGFLSGNIQDFIEDYLRKSK
ncbi:peptide chain release factor 2 [Candidatus Fermentibacteria bacterium]|nr:MAG: peptide chain release factor 2 [Candidatus Fermentibacteria bacterium]